MVAPIKKIVIVGGGVLGWTLALALVSKLKVLQPEIVLLSHSSIDQVAPDDFTSPKINYFHAMLGVDERDLLEQTGASFSLGVEYPPLNNDQQGFIHAFGAYGRALAGVGFHQLAARLDRTNLNTIYEGCSLAALAARKGKFCHPANDSRSIYSSLSYGLHLNTSTYAAYLQRLALARGVVHRTHPIQAINYCAESDKILSIVARDENSDSLMTFDGELFIDCTGARALLMGAFPSHKFMVDADFAALASRAECNMALDHATKPVAQIGFAGSCLYRRIPLANQYSVTAYAIDQMGEEGLVSVLEEHFHLPRGAVSARPMVSGRANTFWRSNCVAIGESAAVIPELGVSALELVRNAIVRLLEYFPDADFSAGNALEYNRLTANEFERVRELNMFILHRCGRIGFVSHKIPDLPDMPAALQHKIELFQKTGSIAMYEEELLTDAEWASLFIGSGMIPEACSAVVGRAAGSLTDTSVQEWCTVIGKQVASASDAMPFYQDYMAGYIKS